MRWRVWYTNGRTFDSDDTDWRALPDDGVLAVRLLFGEGQQTIYGHDHYFHVPGTDLFGGSDDPVEEIHERYPGAIVKRGKWAPTEEWRTVKREAQRYGLWGADR